MGSETTHTPFSLPIPNILCQTSRMRNLTATICLTIAVLFTTKQVFAQEVTFICETKYFSINPNSEILKKLERQNFRLYVSDKSLRYETFLKGQKRAVKHQFTITDTSKGFWIGLGGLLHSQMDHAKMAILSKFQMKSINLLLVCTTEIHL